jgi:hypothetical protein
VVSAETPEPKPAPPRRRNPQKSESAAPSLRRAAAESGDVSELRRLAEAGTLSTAFEKAGAGRRRQLQSGAYAIVYRLVYDKLTRRLERDRGHHHCAERIDRLEPACLDRFYDDVEAVVERLLTQQSGPIQNLEAWIVTLIPKAVLDGNRKRRGRRGAMQRPRITPALAQELGNDPWLTDLAVHILEWVGVTATAGAGLWPLDNWARRRALVKGDAAAEDPKLVTREIEEVLAVMRRRPVWYADFIERPLGHKVAPTAAPPGDEVVDSRPLQPVPDDEVDDNRLKDLAWIATEAMRIRLRDGDDPRQVVTEVLNAVFNRGSGGEEIGRSGGASSSAPERLSELLADPVALPGIINRILGVLGEDVEE